MAQLYSVLKLVEVTVSILLVPIDAPAAPDSRLVSASAAAAVGSCVGALLLLLLLFLLFIVVLDW